MCKCKILRTWKLIQFISWSSSDVLRINDDSTKCIGFGNFPLGEFSNPVCSGLQTFSMAWTNQLNRSHPHGYFSNFLPVILREREVSNFFLRHHTISVLAICQCILSENLWDPQISSVFQSFHKPRLNITVYSHCIDWSRAFTIRLAVEEKKILKCKLSFRWSSHTLTTHWRDSKLKSPFLKRNNVPVQWRKPKGFATTTFFWSVRLKQLFFDLVTTKSTSRCCPPSNASESSIDLLGVKFAWLSDLIIDIYSKPPSRRPIFIPSDNLVVADSTTVTINRTPEDSEQTESALRLARVFNRSFIPSKPQLEVTVNSSKSLLTSMFMNFELGSGENSDRGHRL